eukprot:gb/GECH01006358.1/.p1 GENE.gb/GECH01006358.1/~~gb/GECH01006358.1/.p1  ORF type:complete len:311 (+),score=111.23 gb/GECH01006358.1/:1-933(+)
MEEQVDDKQSKQLNQSTPSPQQPKKTNSKQDGKKQKRKKDPVQHEGATALIGLAQGIFGEDKEDNENDSENGKGKKKSGNNKTNSRKRKRKEDKTTRKNKRARNNNEEENNGDDNDDDYDYDNDNDNDGNARNKEDHPHHHHHQDNDQTELSNKLAAKDREMEERLQRMAAQHSRQMAAAIQRREDGEGATEQIQGLTEEVEDLTQHCQHLEEEKYELLSMSESSVMEVTRLKAKVKQLQEQLEPTTTTAGGGAGGGSDGGRGALSQMTVNTDGAAVSRSQRLKSLRESARRLTTYSTGLGGKENRSAAV